MMLPVTESKFLPKSRIVSLWRLIATLWAGVPEPPRPWLFGLPAAILLHPLLQEALQTKSNVSVRV